MTRPLLEARDVVVRFGPASGARAVAPAVAGVSVAVRPGETLGLVGGSGSGKTTLARTLVGLQAAESGTVVHDGAEVPASSVRRSRAFRRSVQMVFQDPQSSLNPHHPVHQILGVGLRLRGVADRGQRRAEVVRLLEQVGLDGDAADRYPRQFSGGQRQRIAIARALSSDPSVVVLDEPVSALDVSVQAQVLNLLVDLQVQRGLGYLFVAHDLAVVRHVSHTIAVMQQGVVVETGDADAVCASPQHAYTTALLAAVPGPREPAGEPARGTARGTAPEAARETAP